jgi:hypothetical protein
MKNIVVQLTTEQSAKVDQIWHIAICAQNTLDVLSWHNEHNNSSEVIDRTLNTTIANVRYYLRKLEEIEAMKI